MWNKFTLLLTIVPLLLCVSLFISLKPPFFWASITRWIVDRLGTSTNSLFDRSPTGFRRSSPTQGVVPPNASTIPWNQTLCNMLLWSDMQGSNLFVLEDPSAPSLATCTSLPTHYSLSVQSYSVVIYICRILLHALDLLQVCKCPRSKTISPSFPKNRPIGYAT